jgi:hypothetical protein
LSRESGEKEGESVGDDLGDDAPDLRKGDGDPHHEETDGVDDAVLNDFKQNLETDQDDSPGKDEMDTSETGGNSTDDSGEVEGGRDGSSTSDEAEGGDYDLESCLADYLSVLNDSGDDLKETLEPGQDDSTEKQEQETGSSESGGDSGDDSGELESKRDDSAAYEKDGENDGPKDFVSDYQEILNESEAGDSSNEKAEPSDRGSEISEPSEPYEKANQDSGSGSDAEYDKAEPDEKGSNAAEQSKDNAVEGHDSASGNSEKERDDCEAVKGSVESNQQQGSASDEVKSSEPTHQPTDGSEVDDKRGGTSEDVAYGEKGVELLDDDNELFPIRSREYPELFVVDGVRSLVDEGLMPERDEARLGDNTVLSFDVNEGLRILHDEVSYRIVDVEHDRIGDMDLYRYLSDRGEEFRHIPDQDKPVPPTETPWYAYPPNTEVNLDKEYKHELLEAAIDKAGGIQILRDELRERGTEINSMFVYKHMHDLRDSMPEDKLIPILNFLGRDLDEVNSHIISIGHIEAVKHPDIPFDLSRKDGTRLVAARDGDGTLSASGDRGPRFHYSNKDAEMRGRLVESLTNVFGGANIINKEYTNGEVDKVRTTSDIIGYALKRAGAVVGEIVILNPHVPTWIEQGSKENKREWLIQTFGDEGFVWANRGKVCIGRSVELGSVLSQDMIQRLDKMDWRTTRINDRFVDDIRPCKDLPADIMQVIKDHPVNLLVDEKKMLEDLGIIADMYPSEVHRGKYGDYAAHWTLQTKTREDTRRFYTEIGFPQERKQNELRIALRL